MSVIDDVKARLDIVKLVGGYVPLQQAGRSFRASCPFHSERTPSFYVFPERGTWRCFGACAEGGDAFSFLMKKENIPFGEALKRLAEEAGVRLEEPQRSPARVQEEDRLAATNRMAAEHYHRLLLSPGPGEEARRYLAGRGITPEGMDAFQLGLSPQGWEGLKRHLLEVGVEEELQVRAGLLVQGESGSTYDRFRGRLIFPIRDRQGRTVGFGARSLDGSLPKYVNTPQTPLFEKGAVLYGLDRAQETVRQGGSVVIVEGYMDVVQAHQQGFRNVVASMGTALTERQVGLLRGMAHRFVLALDSDAAGEEATRRSLESSWGVFRQTVLVGAGGGAYFPRGEAPELQVLALPPGEDPDELIARDPAEWERRLAQAPPLLEHLFQEAAKRAVGAGPAGKKAVVERLFPLVAALENAFEQDRYFKRLAQVLQIDERTLAASVGRPAARRRRAPEVREMSAAALEDGRRDRLEEHALSLLLRLSELTGEARALSPEHFRRPENREAFARWQRGGLPGVEDEEEGVLSEHLARLREEPLPPLAEREPGRVFRSCVGLLEERRLRALKEEEKALEGAATGNFAHDADRVAALERAERLGALLQQGRGRW